MIEYNNYIVEYNLYGMNEYTVQYCGDDIIFNSVEEAKNFIDEINIKVIKAKVCDLLKKSMTDEHAEILIDDDSFIDFIIDDIMLISDHEENGMYNDSDIKWAIGRAILNQYEIFI